MSTEEHFESLDSDSPNTTPRGERKVFQGRSPGLVSRPSPFYLNMKKEYAQIPTGPNTGRSIVSNQHDISEAKRLYERSGTVERGREGFEFGPDTEQWTATHRYRGEDGEEEKDNFTFQDQDHDDEDIAKKEVVLEIKEKKGGKDNKKKGKKKSEQEKGTNEAEKPVGQEQKAEESKKKKKKNADGGKMPVKKNSEDLGQAGNAEGSVERDEKAEVKKKSGKKGRTNKTKTTNSSNSSIEQEKKNDGDLSAGFKKKPKEMNLRQLMASKNRSNLSISDHHEMTNDPRFLITDSLSCVSSPQSLLALTKGESCPSPSGPQPLKAKTKKKEKVSKKDRKKKYELEPKDGEKPVKQKVKKQHAKEHHHHHHMDEPKRILLTDGLNLVKLMTDRTNCKKTKGLIILYTFTVLWSIVLNGLEFNFFTETRCRTYTENGSAYLSFILMICLKLLSVSLFNLELTFKQPYKPSIGLLYTFAIQCFCPLLQLPQNVYDFSSCKEVNHVIRLRDSWRFLQAVIGTMLGIVAYIVIKQRIEAEVLKSRIGRLLNRIVKGIVILAGLAWNVVLFVVFCAQNNIFLPSLFFDFYLYIVLAVSVIVFNWKKRKLGADGLKAALIKDEKKLNEPLTQSQPVQIKEMVKIEVQP